MSIDHGINLVFASAFIPNEDIEKLCITPVDVMESFTYVLFVIANVLYTFNKLFLLTSMYNM
jgi:hypothetical protein